MIQAQHEVVNVGRVNLLFIGSPRARGNVKKLNGTSYLRAGQLVSFCPRGGFDEGLGRRRPER